MKGRNSEGKPQPTFWRLFLRHTLTLYVLLAIGAIASVLLWGTPILGNNRFIYAVLGLAVFFPLWSAVLALSVMAKDRK